MNTGHRIIVKTKLLFDTQEVPNSNGTHCVYPPYNGDALSLFGIDNGFPTHGQGTQDLSQGTYCFIVSNRTFS